MCLSCICLLAIHTLMCVKFSLPPGVGGWLQLLLVYWTLAMFQACSEVFD